MGGADDLVRVRLRIRVRIGVRARARARVRVRVRRHAGLWPTAEEFASAAHSMALSRTNCHGAASAAAFPPIGSPSARHVASEQATAAALVATTTVQHKYCRDIESAACVEGAAVLFH